MTALRMEHVGVLVTDMDRSLEFYAKTLGMCLRERRSFGALELAFLSCGACEIELVAGVQDVAEPDARVNHIAFRVDDLDRAIADLSGKGIKFEAIVKIWPGLRVVFFRGPDNERLELVERIS